MASAPPLATNPPSTPATPASTAAVAAPAAVSTPAPVPTAVVVPDGLALLTQAFDQLAAGYHFASSGTANGVVLATAEGDHIAGSTRMTTTSQGETVDWVILPDGTWFGAGGVWQESESPAPTSDPITPLRAPQAVTVVSHAPEATTLTATYPAATLSLPGDQPITVTFTMAGSALQTIAYTDPTTGAAVSSAISGLVDLTPITAPSIGE